MAKERPGPVAILAGSGELPLRVAERLRRDRRDCRLIAFRGFADRAVRARADAVIDLLDVRRSAECLRDWQPHAVTLAGGVRRPKPAAVLNAFSLLRNRGELARLLARGDDNLLRAVVGLIEEQGYPVVGVHEIAPELLASTGQLGAHAPTAAERRAVEIGMRLLDAVAAFDIGQAAVVAGERIVAMEGPEGTDAMLARAGRLTRGWLGFGAPSGGVLVKAPKRGQDLRVDLPAVGPLTVHHAKRAGLRGIAVASGATLILDRPACIAAADRLGLFLIGVEAEAGS